jgi:hypothetical protein
MRHIVRADRASRRIRARIPVGTRAPATDFAGLGHIIFDHPGESATEVMLEASDDPIAYMLSQRAHQQIDGDGEDELAEWEAETFANMLMTRLRVFRNRGAGVSVLRFDEALG